MGSVLEDVVELLEDVIEEFEEAVVQFWDEVVVPIAEVVFAAFGIIDNEIVNVRHVSTLVYGDNTADPVSAAITRAIFEKIELEDSFFPAYMRQIYKVKGEIRAYYKYAGQGAYVHGLPDLEVTGTEMDLVAVKAALDTDLGTTNTLLSVGTQYPNPDKYFKYDLQSSHTYLPYVNTLTKDDIYAVSRDDWVLGDINYNIDTDNYTINISRTAEEAKFWIEGPNQITEGDTATFTIRCNRTVPVGETVDINFAYSGSAVDGSDYTQVASVTMLASTDNITVAINTTEKGVTAITGTTAVVFTSTGVLHDIAATIQPILGTSTITVTATSSFAGTILPATGTCNIAVSAAVILRHYFIGRFSNRTQDISIAFNTVGILTGNLPGTRFTILVDSITNTNAAFEMVTVHTLDRKNCLISDDNALKLTMNDVVVDESAGTATVVVKLEEAAPSGAFTVDYNFTDITATGVSGGVGADYDNDTATLNFAGTLGETQNIVIPITSDVANDDYEIFEVFLDNSSDVDSIDISSIATVTIIDGTAAPGAFDGTLNDTITKPNYVRERSIVLTYHLTTDPSTDWFYWIYEFSAGTYIDLEPDMTIITGLEMLPVAILRKNKVSIDINKTTQEYITTRTLLQRLSIRLDDILENIAANPSINDIENAYINFSLGPTSTNRIVSKLLWLQWYELIVTNSLISNVNEYTARFTEGDVNNAVVWTDHNSTLAIVGVVAPFDVVTGIGEYTHSNSGTTLIMQHQVTATEYDELRVFNLNGITAIDYQSYHQVALHKLGDNDFTIPIMWFQFDMLTAKEQLEVYQHIFRFDIYAIHIEHLAWYETEAFAQLFEFVLVVLFVISLGSATSFIVFIQNLAINYAIGELIIWVVEQTGNEVLAAVVGLLAAYYLSDTNFLGENGLPTGEQLLDMSSDFVDNLIIAGTPEQEALAKELETLNEQIEAMEEKNRNQTTVEKPITPEFLIALKQATAERYPAIQGQYDLDQCYDYDSLVSDFCSNEKNIGII